MQINKKKIPEKFFCERCQPRATNVNRAKLKQHKFLKRQSKKAASSSNSNSSSTTPSYKTQTSKLIDIENDSKTTTDSENSSDEDINNNIDSDNSNAEYEELNIETQDSSGTRSNNMERLHGAAGTEKAKACGGQKKSPAALSDNKENKEQSSYEQFNENNNSNDSASTSSTVKHRKQSGSDGFRKTSRNQYSIGLQALQARLNEAYYSSSKYFEFETGGYY